MWQAISELTFILRWCPPHFTGGSTVFSNVRCSGWCTSGRTLLLLKLRMMLVRLLLLLLLLFVWRRCCARFTRRAWAIRGDCCTLIRWTCTCNICDHKRNGNKQSSMCSCNYHAKLLMPNVNFNKSVIQKWNNKPTAQGKCVVEYINT